MVVVAVQGALQLQHRSDVERQRRFHNEFEVYLSLEIAYRSGQLRNRITPHCYGAFEGDGTDVLILGLCGDTLKDWDELNFSEQARIYGLVWDLHRVGIVHGDLEPRNIARVPGGSPPPHAAPPGPPPACRRSAPRSAAAGPLAASPAPPAEAQTQAPRHLPLLRAPVVDGVRSGGRNARDSSAEPRSRSTSCLRILSGKET
ncbi:hypothetical protein EDB84DRAFT_1445680 [Lactarius hengduanensis]|nr:hypothetical protein EDB84DRAFT_1445680 [Lactarius hengduanensis]